jgi:ClpP class serine protease
VFWASRALELGLIDELGDLDRAVDVAAELSGAPRRLLRLRPPRSLRERLLRPAAESLVDAAISEVERRVMVSGLRY